MAPDDMQRLRHGATWYATTHGGRDAVDDAWPWAEALFAWLVSRGEELPRQRFESPASHARRQEKLLAELTDATIAQATTMLLASNIAKHMCCGTALGDIRLRRISPPTYLSGDDEIDRVTLIDLQARPSGHAHMDDWNLLIGLFTHDPKLAERVERQARRCITEHLRHIDYPKHFFDRRSGISMYLDADELYTLGDRAEVLGMSPVPVADPSFYDWYSNAEFIRDPHTRPTYR